MPSGSIPAVLFDGLSTASQQVVLRAMAPGLLMSTDQGADSLVPYSAISSIEQTGVGFRCSFSALSPDGEKCILQVHFTDTAFFNHLNERCQSRQSFLKKAAQRLGRLNVWQITLSALAALGIFLYTLSIALAYAYTITPLSFDTRLGESVDSAFSRIYTPCSTPALDAFFTKAIKQLSLPSDRFPHRVVILNDSTQNAVAVPGGTIYVFRGLLEKSSSPDELVGVLSHELVHSEERHTVRQIIKSSALSYILTLGIGAAIDGFDMLDGLERTLEMSGVLWMLRYSRDFERQADSLCIMRLHRAALKVGPLDSLLTRLSPPPRMRDRLLSLFATHPLARERSMRFQNARSLETFSPDTIFSFERLTWHTIKKGCPAQTDSIPLWKRMLR